MRSRHSDAFEYTVSVGKRLNSRHCIDEEQENIAPLESVKRRKLADGKPEAVGRVSIVSGRAPGPTTTPMDMEVTAVAPLARVNNISRNGSVFTPPPARSIAVNKTTFNTPRSSSSSSSSSKSIHDVMRSVIVYVEVMTIDEDRSDQIKSVAAAMGAQVNDKLYRNTTHVIFREGSMTTYKKAIKMGIPLVSVTWLEECRKTLKIAEPALFPPINLDPYERPELYKRVRKAVPINGGDVTTTPERFALKPTRPEDELEKALLEYQQTKVRLGMESPLSTPPSISTTQLGRTCLNFSPIGESTKIAAPPKTPSQSCVTPLLRRLMIRNAEEDRRERDLLVVGRSQNALKEKELPVLEETRFDRVTMDLSSMWGKDLDTTPQRTNHAIVSMVEDSVDLTGSSPEECNKTITPVPKTSSTSAVMKALRRQTLLFTQNASMDISPVSVKENVAANQPAVEDSPEADTVKVPKICGLQRKSLEEDTLREDIVRAKEQLLGKAVVINKSDKRRSLLPSAAGDADATLVPVASKVQRRRTLFNIAAISEGGLSTDETLKSLPKQATKRRTLLPSAPSTSQSAGEDKSKKSKKTLSSPMKPPQVVSQLESLRISNMGPPKAQRIPKGNDGRIAGERPKGSGKKVSVDDSATTKKRKLFSSVTELSPISSPVQSPARLRMSNLHAFSPKSSSEVQKKLNTVASERESVIKRPAKSRRSTLDFQTPSLPSKGGQSHSSISSSSSSSREQSRPQSSKNVIVLTNGQPSHLNFIKELVKRIGGSNYEVDTRVTTRTTHLVCYDKKRNMNMLRGVIRGVWMLEYKWIEESSLHGKWQREEDYQVNTFGNTLTRVQAERGAFGSNYKMDLFSGAGRFFVFEMDTVPVHHVKELIMLCGGIVVDQAEDAKYLVADKVRPGVQVISPSWVFDCVCQYTFINPKRYHKK